MPQLTMRDALNQALHQEMARDERVIVLGEDVSGGAGGTSGEREASGGIFGVTKGLLPKFGEGRVLDTPISESAIVGAAAGAALAGLRPVAEIMFADFVGVCMDQIYNQIAKFRYMFGGKSTCPVVIRMAMGAGMNMGPQHSQTIYSLLTAVPGLKVVIPSNAYDAKGLLIQAIRDDDPVIFFEHKALYPRKAEVPEQPYTVPFGEANLVREGEHVTVVAFARMVPFAERAIDALAKEGITCDLIDPRTTSPLDEDTIIESVEGTGRGGGMLGQHLQLDPAVGGLLHLLSPDRKHVFGQQMARRHPARHGEGGLRGGGPRHDRERCAGKDRSTHECCVGKTRHCRYPPKSATSPNRGICER